ncbi:MAG: hypothetical protein DBX39_05870 [Bacillota bacterium]|nr:MAG: hypothetical protein DBX39_05870 [Bacillota bacterium]
MPRRAKIILRAAVYFYVPNAAKTKYILFSPRAFSEKRMGADRCEISKKSIGKSYIGVQTERIFYKNYVEI